VTGCPDFIIAGAMRAGSTALAQALAEHHAVFMATPKEPNFFAVPCGALEFRGPGDQGFARRNITDWQSYQELFRDAGTRSRGEASAMYLTLPGVASGIRSTCPDAKIVFILRDPVQRAFSAWQYLRGQGREHLRDFAAALAAEEERRSRGYGPLWWYVEAGRYDVGLQHYLAAFPRTQLHLLTTEELRRDPSGAMSRVCEFIGVNGSGFHASALSGEVNRSGVPRVEMLTRALHPPARLADSLARVAPPAVKRLVRRARGATVAGVRQMPSEARQWLGEELSSVAPEVQRLTGLDTKHWQGGSP